MTPSQKISLHPDDLWFGAKDGAYCYDGNALQFLAFPKTAEADAYYKKHPNMRPYSIYCIFKDSKGHIWFGTEALGVCHYDGKNFTWIAEQHLSGAPVRAIFEDKKGTFWLSNNGMGVYQYDGNTLTNFTEKNGLSNADFVKIIQGKTNKLPNPLGKEGTMASIMAMAGDNNGSIWIGTYDAGLWSYDGNKLTNYTTKDGLLSKSVMAIYNDVQGTLWVGTDGSGIYKWNGKTFIPFTI